MVKGKIALLRKLAFLGRRLTHVLKIQLPAPQVLLGDYIEEKRKGLVLRSR